MNLARQCAFTSLIVCAESGCGDLEVDVYLFDCQGNIASVDGGDLALGGVAHLSSIDSTLPLRVRDGCLIGRGWYDSVADRLFLEIHLQAAMDASDLPPTETMQLAVPDLRLVERRTSTPTPGRRVDLRGAMGTILSVQSAFPSSSVHYLSGEGMILLQELAVGDSARPARGPIVAREAGVVELQRVPNGATGRYALYDVAGDGQREESFIVGGDTDDDTVVCVTPHGLVLIAVTRDSLVVVDTRGAHRIASLGAVGLDLYWTACTWHR